MEERQVEVRRTARRDLATFSSITCLACGSQQRQRERGRERERQRGRERQRDRESGDRFGERRQREEEGTKEGRQRERGREREREGERERLMCGSGLMITLAQTARSVRGHQPSSS